MLVTPIFAELDERMMMIERIISGGKDNAMDEVRKGVFITTSLNAQHQLLHGQQRDFKLSYPDLGEFNSYGVCDNWEQVIEQCPQLETDGRKFVVFLCEIRKDEQSPQGGWRWHKWGPYIGKHEPQCEYLYDEEGIERVFVYHITQLMDDEVAP